MQAGEAVRARAGGRRPNGLFQNKQEEGLVLRAVGSRGKSFVIDLKGLPGFRAQLYLLSAV